VGIVCSIYSRLVELQLVTKLLTEESKHRRQGSDELFSAAILWGASCFRREAVRGVIVNSPLAPYLGARGASKISMSGSLSDLWIHFPGELGLVPREENTDSRLCRSCLIPQ